MGNLEKKNAPWVRDPQQGLFLQTNVLKIYLFTDTTCFLFKIPMDVSYIIWY